MGDYKQAATVQSATDIWPIRISSGFCFLKSGRNVVSDKGCPSMGSINRKIQLEYY